MTRHTALRTPLLASAFAASLLSLALGAAAQTTTRPSTTAGAASGVVAVVTKSALDHSDRKFVEKATEGGLAEVALGKIAQQRASNAKVKSFGDQMVQDHGKANDELNQLAASKSVAVATAPSRSQQRDADKLNKLSGADFDRAYMKQMLDDHKKDVAEFQKVARSAKDSDVKAFASRTLPTLQSHLQMAQSTYDEVKNSKGGASSTAPAMPASR